MQRVALHRGGEHIRSRCGLQQDVSGSMCAIGSSGIMMRVVQGRTNGHDSSSYGPTDELRSKWIYVPPEALTSLSTCIVVNSA